MYLRVLNNLNRKRKTNYVTEADSNSGKYVHYRLCNTKEDEMGRTLRRKF